MNLGISEGETDAQACPFKVRPRLGQDSSLSLVRGSDFSAGGMSQLFCTNFRISSISTACGCITSAALALQQLLVGAVAQGIS